MVRGPTLFRFKRAETNLQRRRIVSESEIIFLRGNKKWVGDQRMLVETALPPLFKGRPGEFHLVRLRNPVGMSENIPKSNGGTGGKKISGFGVRFFLTPGCFLR